MTPHELEAAGWSARAISAGFTELVGAFWSRRDGDGWRYAALPGERHLNGQGAVHGGFLLTFADHALGLVVWQQVGRRPCVTAQLNMHFVGGARADELLELDAEIVRAARSMVFVRGTLRAGTRTVAVADGIWKILGPAAAVTEQETRGEGKKR